MRLAIRYCGGCNPRYDRVSAVQALSWAMPGAQLLFAPEELPTADALLAVCGCSARCASLGPAEAWPARVLWLDEPSGLPGILQQLCPELQPQRDREGERISDAEHSL